jgi:serine/threonine protein kinase
MRADCSDENEIKVLETFAADSECHPGQAYVMILKDHFSLEGPNGTHRCHVQELMGPSISALRTDCILGQSSGGGQSKRIALHAARAIIFQTLIGLDFMHEKGLVHGDLYAANILLSLRDLSQLQDEDLRQSPDKISEPVRRLDGKRDPGDPRFLTLDEPLHERVALGRDLQVRISDLGNCKAVMVVSLFNFQLTCWATAFFRGLPPNDLQTPVDVRSPELLFHKTVSAAQDVWAFGCLVYLLFTNSSLFQLTSMGTDDDLDDAHILQLIALFGPLAGNLREVWPRCRKYFDDQGVQTTFEVDYDYESIFESLDDFPEEDEDSNSNAEDLTDDDNENHVPEPRSSWPLTGKPPQDLYPSLIEVYHGSSTGQGYHGSGPGGEIDPGRPFWPPFSDRWRQDRHPGMASEEAEAVLDLLSQIFRYQPDERPTMRAMLNHPWVAKYCAGNLGAISQISD